MGRLIDVDALIQKLKRTSVFECVRNSADKNVFEIINEQPTAYNVENVVAELEERKGNVIIVGKIMYQENYFIDIDSAIDIVKAGGVDD